MALKLMYITNDVCVAQIARAMELTGFSLILRYVEKRSGRVLDTVISGHTVTDVRKIAAVLKRPSSWFKLTRFTQIQEMKLIRS